MDTDFLAALHTVQRISFVVISLVLVGIIYLMILDKKNSLKHVGFLSWAIHGFLYYGVYSTMTIYQMANVSNGEFFTGWSAALRLHGFAILLVVIGDEILRVLR